jgi:hypothetical protein
LRACIKLGWTDVDVHQYANLSARDRLEIVLEENTLRRDLSQPEQSRIIARLSQLGDRHEAPQVTLTLQLTAEGRDALLSLILLSTHDNAATARELAGIASSLSAEHEPYYFAESAPGEYLVIEDH